MQMLEISARGKLRLDVDPKSGNIVATLPGDQTICFPIPPGGIKLISNVALNFELDEEWQASPACQKARHHEVVLLQVACSILGFWIILTSEYGVWVRKLMKPTQRGEAPRFPGPDPQA